MGSFWDIIGLVAVAAIVFLISKPRIARAEANAAEEKAKADISEKARQKLEVELAGVRSEASRIEGLTAKALKDTETITDLKEQCASKETAMAEREKALADERKQLGELKAEFRAQFAELSVNALKDNSANFLNEAKSVLALQHKGATTDLETRQHKIEEMVRPIQEGIMAVSAAAKAMEIKREGAFSTIEDHLRQSVANATEVARQTSALKDALKRPIVRGRWGEVQLRNCVELAGMEDHCDVEFQVSSVSPDEERIRPDMIVRMPGGRRIAVDSKTPMEHFLKYVGATTDEDRTAALTGHARAVKNHVGDLVKSDYMQKVAESPDFVVMFLPNESFLAMALEKEPTLMEDALTKKVVITTPGTLIGLLKVVRYGWNEQKIAVNAQNIADEGEKLNTEITRFLEDFAKLGNALKTASEAYDSSLRRVEKQIITTSTSLTSLGAKSRKALTDKTARTLKFREAEEVAGEHSETLALTEVIVKL